jgi:hypothetical protein
MNSLFHPDVLGMSKKLKEKELIPLPANRIVERVFSLFSTFFGTFLKTTRADAAFREFKIQWLAKY